MRSDPSPILELRNISFSAQNTGVVKNVSYSFAEGAVHAITGGAGSGKSTLLKLAAGLLVPNAGSAHYRGQDIAAMTKKENAAFHRASGFVFQDSALWANQSIYQILELPLRAHFPAMTEAARRTKIEAVLSTLSYAKGTELRPERLSAGEQKLIAFARAIICDPAILFLDEWTASLDEAACARLLDIVKDCKAQRRTIVFVNHDPHVVAALADFVLTVNNGELSGVRHAF
jgi:ABC-type lipoprotein export system ATPase subunit